MEIILYAIGLGFLLSLVLIGPVFFLLIETSLTKGWRAAIALDLGVILADLLCILAAYWGAKDLTDFIETHPSLYRIGGFIIIIYGLVLWFSKPKLHIQPSGVVTTSYVKTFVNGFLMNLLNIGIVMFWFVVVGWVTLNYPTPSEFFVFMGTTLATFAGIEVSKIFLAKRLKEKMSDAKVIQIRKIMGLILAGFGAVIILKSFYNLSDLLSIL